MPCGVKSARGIGQAAGPQNDALSQAVLRSEGVGGFYRGSPPPIPPHRAFRPPSRLPAAGPNTCGVGVGTRLVQCIFAFFSRLMLGMSGIRAVRVSTFKPDCSRLVAMPSNRRDDQRDPHDPEWRNPVRRRGLFEGSRGARDAVIPPTVRRGPGLES